MSSAFFDKEATAVVNMIDQSIAQTCDKLYRNERYRRQWAFIEIKKRIIQLMKNEEKDLEFLENELKKREDNMWSYLQAERCPACNKVNCRLHCNFKGCGMPIEWRTEQGYQYIGKDNKIYPMNPDTSPHLLCHLLRTRPDDKQYYLKRVQELVREKEIEWRKKKNE
jgi:hypothetical protein